MAYGCVSYSLFGYGKQKHKDSFEFSSYLRGLEINIRIAQLVYPHYKIYLNTDKDTFNAFEKLFKSHKEFGCLDYTIHKEAPLTEAMLWRMFPIFDGYDRVLCRDADSLLSPREAKCVRYWEQSGRVVHSLADSISHTEILMGGLVGFASKEFRGLIKCETWEEFQQFYRGYDYSRKGCDQDFLKERVLPKVHQTLVEHHMKGIPNTFRSQWFNTVPDMDMGFPPAYDEIDRSAWHLGAAGFNESAILKFLSEHGQCEEYFKSIERKYPNIFYWRL